jgi:hypothetical protein
MNLHEDAISDRTLEAARKLHRYLLATHWDGHALTGPDPGIRFNARIGRFIKHYTGFLPWRDNVAYMQAQGYWILDNWLMYDLHGESRFRDVAISGTDFVSQSQQPGGYWEYPNREWKGRIATVEGCFATLGLLETFARTGDDKYLSGARQWHDYVVREMGFQAKEDTLAINYFANLGSVLVPNNSTLALQTFATLADVTGDDEFLSTCPGMVRFLSRVQLSSGELPYFVTDLAGNGRLHFLCYQYNAFEFIDLVEYHRLTGDADVMPILEQLARYLAGGITPAGCGRYDCSQTTPEVLYYSLAIAQALSQATALGLGSYQDLVDRTYANVLMRQRDDGRFTFHSRANYYVLCDRRSYPRYLSMILRHLLLEHMARRGKASGTKPLVKNV